MYNVQTQKFKQMSPGISVIVLLNTCIMYMYNVHVQTLSCKRMCSLRDRIPSLIWEYVGGEGNIY